MMAELHARGTTPEDIRDCLRSAPLDAHVVSAVKTAAALGYTRHHADTLLTVAFASGTDL